MDLLIDTNIIIDILQNRPLFVENSQKIISAIKNKQFKGFIAAHSITNLWYILRKTHTQEKRRELILTLLDFFEIVSLSKQKLINALLRKDFLDFEDCLQDECAIEFCADYIITRNPKDFNNAKVSAITPEEFIKLKDM